MHLTAIGVEEYTSEVTTDTSTDDTVTDVPVSAADADNNQINMWNSWAIYTSIVMLILLTAGILWGYRKDKRDEIY